MSINKKETKQPEGWGKGPPKRIITKETHILETKQPSFIYVVNTETYFPKRRFGRRMVKIEDVISSFYSCNGDI